MIIIVSPLITNTRGKINNRVIHIIEMLKIVINQAKNFESEKLIYSQTKKEPPSKEHSTMNRRKKDSKR